MTNYEDSDEYCPHCDNHYVRADRAACRVLMRVRQVIDAKTPQAVLGVEGEDARVDARSVSSTLGNVNLIAYRMLKDDRIRQDPNRSLFRPLD